MQSCSRCPIVLLSLGISAAMATDTRSISATFVCDGGKKIQATFTTGSQPTVQLSLSDGRHLVLPQ